MKSVAMMASFLVVGVLYTLGADVALADGVRGVAVEPLSPKPGEAITVKGEMLGPNSTVEVRVLGSGIDLGLGEAKADDEGDFTAQFTLPADLVPGAYELRATGAESATTQMRVAAAGGTMNPGAPAAEIQTRERPLAEKAGLVALFGVLAGLGLFLARTPTSTPVSS